MSRKCPNCGSYNTEVSIGNYAGRALLNAGRYTLALGASLVVGAFSHSAGHVAGHSYITRD